MSGLVFIVMFESITIDNESEYYTLKDAMKAAMLESIDVGCYRNSTLQTKTASDGSIVVDTDANGEPIFLGCNGKVKISEQKFVENFTRRFAKSIRGDVDSYTLEFYDLIESPPKVSVKIKSTNGDYDYLLGDNDINIANGLSAILETKN